MKKIFLSILCSMLVFFGLHAEEYTYTFAGKVFSANGTQTLNSCSQTSSKAIYIKSITVTYTPDGGAGGETPEPVDVVEPTFTPADETTFDENLTVTINADDDIYYSTDGENYSKYTAAIVITETATVYAYAQDAEGNQSDFRPYRRQN